MKKPLTIPDESQPRNVTRADLVMTEGYGLEVDGRMKTVFPTLEAAQKRARDLKAEFPMLQVKVYDAAEKKLLEFANWVTPGCDGHRYRRCRAAKPILLVG